MWLIQEALISHSPEGQEGQITEDLVSEEGPSFADALFADAHPFLVREQRGNLHISSYKGTYPIHEGSILLT